MSRPIAPRLRRLVGAGLVAIVSLALVQVGASAGSDAPEGLLRVTTSPAVDAPVRIDGETRNVSTVAGLAVEVGTHLVCFGSVPGFVAPPCQSVVVDEGAPTDVVGRFARAGTLQVRTEPNGTRTDISVDGIVRDVGAIRIVVPVGAHEVCFGRLTGHTTPACRTVEVTAGGTVGTVGTYRTADQGTPPPAGDTAPATGDRSPTAAPRAGGALAAACPAGDRLRSPFADLGDGGSHSVAVACAQAWGIITGRTATAFAPGETVTRAQVATMLHRLIQGTGADLPGTPARFADVAGSPHQQAIEALAGAGIINGRSDGSFGPDAPVRRDQMAALLVRTLAEVYGLDAALGAGFPDVPAGSVHAENVRRLVGAGITQGNGDGRYEPDRSVSRAQMATFVMRLADVLVQAEAASPPAAVS